MSLQAILYSRGKLQLLDQRRLPHEFTYLDVPDPKTAWHHIRDMVVRGAPAIGVTGVLAIAADLVTNKGAGSAFKDATDAVTYINTTLDYLVTRCVESCW
jgi:methylthioribose-1-phosphate isomerase